jgi:hypothetical protein
MVKGMAFMQILSSIMFACSGIYVYWNYNTVIFPDRVAPKFLFDMFVAALYVPFALFWQ